MTLTASDRDAFVRRVGRWMAKAVSAIAIVSIVASCGGGNPPDQEGPPPLPTMTGTVVGSDVSDPSTRYAEPTAKGASGTARVANAPLGSLDYEVRLSGLTGPFAVNVYFENNSAQLRLVTLATEAGVANATVLTHLMTAQLFAQDPEALFEAYDATSAASVTADSLAAAQRNVRAHLRDALDLSLDADSGDFVTAPFEPVPGDSMYDAILAVLSSASDKGLTFADLVQRVALAARPCRLDKIAITIDGLQSDFCPGQKSALPDSDDAAVTVYRFGIENGAVLTVSVRGGAVLSARFVRSGARSNTCRGASCSGINLGAQASDGSRPFRFDNVRLAGSDGGVLFSGTLQGSAPGYSFPPLSCDDGRYFLAYSDFRTRATCASTSGAGGNGSGELSGPNRAIYTFSGDGAVNPAPEPVEVRIDGERVHSVFVRDVDPSTGETRGLYLCRTTECSGVVIGASRDVQVEGFEPQRQRDVDLDETVLVAVNADGTPAVPAASVTVSGSLIGTASAVVRPTGACASTGQRLQLLPSDQTVPLVICPPLVLPEFATADLFLNTTGSPESGLSFFIASAYEQDGVPLFPSGDDGGVRLNVAADGSVSDVAFVPRFSQRVRFACVAGACSGIAVSPPDGAGARTVRFDNTVLREVETGDLPGDRSITVDGAFVAPPPAF